MLLRIYEVQIHYKILYFDIDITISYILLYYVLNIISCIITYLSSRFIGYYFRIFDAFYFISILIPNFWSGFWHSFVFQIHFTKNIPLCTDPQLFCQCRVFVNVTMVVNSSHPNLSFLFYHVYVSSPTLIKCQWNNHMFPREF